MLLEVKNLTKMYRNDMSLSLFRPSARREKAVDGVTFHIRKGELVGLVGESGCGKSTLSRLLVKLEPPTGGDILFEGQRIHPLRGAALKDFRKSCQLIFQDTASSLNPSLKIRTLLSEPLDNYYSLTRAEKNRKISALMDKVGLRTELLNRYPRSLSGGEKQRISICRSLLLEPKLLICDEIVSSLDVTSQASLLRLLKQLNRESGLALLFISHDLEAVRKLCDRILVMDKGKIVEEVKNTEEPVYRHPCTARLFSSLLVNHPKERMTPSPASDIIGMEPD
nr:dipeptide/oligopeptide/nickel ABC transporter ATP-binding protein [Aneurinibacillus sp. XH2]